METAIVAINLNDGDVNFFIDLSNIEKLFNKTYQSNTVVMVQNWLK
jgi:hypothetical protein